MRIMHWLQWVRQGRPTRYPVTVRDGWLVIVADGGQYIVNWTFWLGKMEVPLEAILTDPDYKRELWEHLARLYPRRIVWLAPEQWEMTTRTWSA